MLPYWLLFAFPALMAITSSWQEPSESPRWPQNWKFMFLILVLMVGLRHEVGGDWANYVGALADAKYFSLNEVLNKIEPGYNLLNWITAQSGLNIYFVDLVCGIIFAWGTVEFCLAQPRPWLAMVVAIPYLVIVVAMGYSRQGVAIGFVMLAFVALGNLRYFRFAVYILLAVSFHQSAIILIPLAALTSPKNRLWNVTWVAVFTLVLFSEFLGSTAATYQFGYIDQAYQSEGATIRVVMNVVPAALFLFFRSRFALSKVDIIFWTWQSLIAIGLLGILLVSPSSTAADRIALYMIPLQLFVYARLPEALGVPEKSHTGLVYTLVGFSAMVQFTWLVFGVHSRYWLPYKFAPLLWLIQ